MLFFRTNHTTIEAIGIKKDGSPEDSLWGLAWTTKNIKKTHKRLLDAGLILLILKMVENLILLLQQSNLTVQMFQLY